ncbi:MAG: LysE family translocator [Acidimicrobiia bacterium]|nr:LysE family translocator [Acidimicrobiia bacterium]
MPSSSAVAAFAALAFALIVIPGPSVMFVISRGVALGRRAAVLTVAGNAAGVYAQVVVVALGLGVVVERSIVVFTAVKLIGAVYLAWLGIQAIRHRRELSSVLDSNETFRPERSLLTDAFIVGVANPKTIVYFASVLPQFVAAGGAPAGIQMAFLGLVFVVIALVSDGIWGMAAGSAHHWFARSPRRLERLRAAGGVTMVGLGIHLLVAGRKN